MGNMGRSRYAAAELSGENASVCVEPGRKAGGLSALAP